MSNFNWVLLASHNNRTLTADAIASVFAQDIENIRLLIIDDNSTDGTAQWLHSVTEPRVWLMSITPNRGLTWVWNHGLTTLFDEVGAEEVLVINNDVMLPACYYRHLHEAPFQFVSGVGVHEKEQMTGAKPDPSSVRPHPDFSAFLIKKGCWQTVGPFDPQFEMWNGDGNFHLCMQQAGIKAVCLDVPYWHRHGGSSSIKLASPWEQKRIQDIAERDRAAFFKKWGVAMGTPAYEAMFK